MNKALQNFSRVWLIFLTVAATLAFSNANTIEAFTLNRTLHFGFDAFGRNCIGLSFLSAFETLKTAIPIGILCLAISLLFSFLLTLRHARLLLVWNAMLDTLASLPGLLIALSVSVFIGNQFSTVLLATVFIIIPYLIRFFESQIFTIQNHEFVKSAEALGATRWQVYVKHLFPELWASVIAILPFLMTRLILIDTSLAFFGLNSHQHHETWGSLLYQGKEYLLEAPWIAGLGALPLFLTLLSFHSLSSHRENP
jgi:peptide/nickel transport system permease protein